ncbi:MAG: M28 family metallopeptidase [Halieaceae bacterium]|nr:M28 family metallopeptidase [Halieaceae bacterium]
MLLSPLRAARLSALFALFALLTACSRSEQPPVAETPAATGALDAQRSQVEADLHTHTEVMASDAFGGRGPGTPGEEMTVNYLVEQFEGLGLEPGNGESWVQEVPITAVTTDPSAVLAIRGSDFKRDLRYADEMVVFTQRQVESIKVEDSALVFVGYGIAAPERGWDDYGDLDVAGKTVVILINDPGYATQDPEVFNGNTMTYYGRWTYKYEEAARRGAAAAIIVHQTAPAAYGWDVVRNSWSGPQIGLTADNQNLDRVAAEGWITESVARELFTAAGADFDALKAAAAQPGFQAVPLGDLTLSTELSNTLTSSRSRNVMARLPGTAHPDEHIVYSAHWDHLGTKEGEGDQVYNGASDNASGTAALLALARLHMEDGAAPRSLLFLAVTAEESGLLGAEWYVKNPPHALETTVANLNMDNIYGGVDGRTRDVAVVGFGNSELEYWLAIAADRQDRVLVQEPNPEKGYYYRSDHFNFARYGVPALYLTRGVDSLEHDREWGQQQLINYVVNDYHKPSDEYSPDWDLSGAADNVVLFYDIATALAAGRDWPNWNEGTEFKATRDESSAARAP